MESAQQLFEMGVPLDEEQVYEVSQWRKPAMGSGIVSQVGSMQAQMPQQGQPIGTPQIGQPGPQGQPQGQMPDPTMGQSPQQMGRRGRLSKLMRNKPKHPVPVSIPPKRLQRKKIVFS
jgi:hypothetical protein